MTEQDLRNKITQVLNPKIVRGSLDTPYILASPWHYAELVNELAEKLIIPDVVVSKGTCCLNPKKIGKVNDMFESWDECKNCGKEIV